MPPAVAGFAETSVNAITQGSVRMPNSLGMLYGYESQTPAVARTKVAGLKEHYGIQDAGVDYFELHADLDVEHSADLAAAIGSLADDDGALSEAAAGARAGRCRSRS